MKRELHKALNVILNSVGFELCKFPYGSLKRKIEFLRHYQTDTIIDVGANTGQFAESVLHGGFKGRIVSIEPLSSAFSILQKKTLHRHNWEALQMALGDFDGESTINVSRNSASSSILPIKEEHLAAAPESRYISTEIIKVSKLDSIFNQFIDAGREKVFLKIDTQGFEKNVITGAELSLQHIDGVQLEMSLVELYEGEPTFLQMISLMESYGFMLFSLEPGYSNPFSKQMLQVDGIFLKRNLLKA